MNVEEITKLAQNEKAIAVRMLSSALGFPDNVISGAAELAVDKIVNATLLEIAALNQQAADQARVNTTSSPNA